MASGPSPTVTHVRRLRTVPAAALSLLAALVFTAAACAGPAAPAAAPGAVRTGVPATTPGCSAGPAGVPQKAFTVADYARAHGGSPPPGYVGGTTFDNRERHLDSRLGPFREYDVNPHRAGVDRGPRRVVLGRTHAASYYTGDHYTSFVTMYGDPCTG